MMYKNNPILVCDGNEAAADSAYRANEICVIYPITPASSMGELADIWATEGRPNFQGTIPKIVEMQSEGGVSGAMHGATQTGALVTTFTSSQGLLLMIPNMYRISAELSPTTIHVASRVVASQGMIIYSEHSDVMATRATGFGLISSVNVQEAHDMALVAQSVSLKTRVPFVHFFDGMRTSHEVSRIERITDEQLKAMLDSDAISSHRLRRLSPDQPVARGTIQHPDTYFQGRESVNPYYDKTVDLMEKELKRFQDLTGREYHVMEYYGHRDAERVIVIMCSGADTVYETVDYLIQQGEKVGCIKIRLFQPFSSQFFLKTLPQTCRSIAVLDRTKEPGACGEPLYQKISSVLMAAVTSEQMNLLKMPKVIGGRFGLGGKEFTPGMVKAIFDELKLPKPKNNFTIGITDDVTQTNLQYDDTLDIELPDVVRAIFYGLGSDGTVSANKNTVKIVGEETDSYVQAGFLFNPKKTGSKTVSHLRFSPRPIRSAYFIQSAHFVACHQFHFLEKFNVLINAAEGATFLLNSPFSKEEVWDHLPRTIQKVIIDKKLKFYVLDAYRVAQNCGLGTLINTIMQTGFFALTSILPQDKAIQKIKASITKAYAHKGAQVVQKNLDAIDQALEHLSEVKVPDRVTSPFDIWSPAHTAMTSFEKDVVVKMLQDRGDELPVSAVPDDGTFPVQTTCWEKPNVSRMCPRWVPEACIQCGRCSFVCPHSAIRAKKVSLEQLKQAPSTFKTIPCHNDENKRFALQVYVEECTGCGLCIEACPVKEKALKRVEKAPFLEQERCHVEFFESLSYGSRKSSLQKNVSGIQYLEPLFEFSGACAGCGEAPYVRLLTQLFGNRATIANACGCSSVFGGTLPSIPWTKNAAGWGPAWSSSLFEDNAEFGFGFRLTASKHREYARELLQQLSEKLDATLVNELLQAPQHTEEELELQRQRIARLKEKLASLDDPRARELMTLAVHLLRPSIWSVGGDGWAYDIGFGGLDHVVADHYDINLLVLDTEVYSNTGGQSSKATPRGSVVKFAAQGKPTAKKDLGLIAMTYGHVYVAQIAMGANPAQTIKAFLEAEAYPGPSLIIAYCPCIAHGINMRRGLDQQTLAVKSGCWPLYRYDPTRIQQGLNPMQLDSQAPSIPLEEYLKSENRYRILEEQNPEAFQRLLELAKLDVARRWQQYESLASK